ncbi:hypothetical protein RGUI_0471 [Rhodovulum sp. P5]|nr:hypothetical protein RGUI_0471 [Rhodovulum sp. P5]
MLRAAFGRWGLFDFRTCVRLWRHLRLRACAVELSSPFPTFSQELSKPGHLLFKALGPLSCLLCDREGDQRHGQDIDDQDDSKENAHLPIVAQTPPFMAGIYRAKGRRLVCASAEPFDCMDTTAQGHRNPRSAPLPRCEDAHPAPRAKPGGFVRSRSDPLQPVQA